jgi:hypothetical protein
MNIKLIGAVNQMQTLFLSAVNRMHFLRGIGDALRCKVALKRQIPHGKK